MTQRAQQPVDRIAAAEESEHRRPTAAQLLLQGEQLGAFRIDAQTFAHRVPGLAAVFFRQQAGSRQIDVVLGLEELELDGVFAEFDALLHLVALLGEGVTEVGEVGARNSLHPRQIAEGGQLGQPFFVIAEAAQVEASLAGSQQLFAGHVGDFGRKRFAGLGGGGRGGRSRDFGSRSLGSGHVGSPAK